jgi:hypothetical protein
MNNLISDDEDRPFVTSHYSTYQQGNLELIHII